MKHFLVKLKITCGTYEYAAANIFPVESSEAADLRAEQYAHDFYDNADEKQAGEGDGYYFNGGEVHVKVASVTEIPAMEAAVLKTYLPI